ncbi:TonB-dependent receptor domain-containing protein [Algihabitans sp.]|uniref:TonB-dependent receptor domain-containing protein n=1 Tax=Algihabitans sp. TaxID=2821514 RepID=UPI003BA8D818
MKVGVFLSAPGRCRPAVRGGLLISTAALAMLFPPAQVRAQSQSAPPVVAQVQQIDFAIPPQPLFDALALFGRQSGLQVSVDADLVRDLESPGATGSFSPEQALRRLLAGTGISYRIAEGDTVFLQLAATQLERGPLVLDPITIRGEIRDRPLADSPTSAVVVTGEELERSGGDEDLYDLINRTPGITSNGENEGFVIRGIDNRGTNFAGGQTINVQIDGVSLPNFASVGYGPYSTWDLEQVEILRGPQSTQQGRNALAGAVIVRSADPVFVPEYKARGELGSDDLRRGSVALNQPLGENFALRLSIDALESDGFVNNPTRGGASDPASSRTYRAKLRWAPTDEFDAVLSYTRAETFGGGDGDVIEEALFPDERVNFSNRENREGADHDIFGLRLRYDLTNSLTLNSETSYLNRQGERLVDEDGTAEDAPFAETNNAFFRDFTPDVGVFEQDVFLDFALGRFTGTAGVFYTQIDDDRRNLSTFDFTGALPPIPGLDPIQTSDAELQQDTENLAVYGEVDIGADELIEGLSFTLGGRYERETVDIDSTLTFDPGGFPPAVVAAFPPLADSSFEGSDTFSAFLPKVGVNYDFDGGDQRVSLTYQRGYRAGGVRATNTGQRNDFEAEFSDTLELAYRGAFLEDRLAFRANAFYSRIEDQQVNIFGVSGAPSDFLVENAGKSRLYGAEFSLEAAVTEDLSVRGGLALVETEFRDFVSNDVDFSGNRFAGTRPITASLSVDYVLFDNWFLNVTGIYNDSAFADAANTSDDESDDWFIANAQLAFEHEIGLTAGAYVNNLFDKDYIVSRADGIGSGGLVEPALAGAPRQIGLFLQYQF